MFSSIKVSGYKGIAELALFKIPRILLIGGRNNVGKSSLLEAIFLVLDRMNPELLSRHFAFRGVGLLPLNPDSLWRPSFCQYNLSTPIEVELCDSRSKCLKLRVAYDPSFTSFNIQQPNTVAPNAFQTSSSAVLPVQALHITATYANRVVQDSDLIIQAQGFALQVKNAEPTPIPGVYISSTARSSPREDATRFGQLDLENRTGPILDVVRLVEPRVLGLSVVAVGDGAEIHADVDGFPRKIPISLMGDGVGRILSITLALFVSPGGVVLVDEIENGLHHSKLPGFWKAITKASIEAECQLIATTHNYECLSAASQSTADIDKSSFAYVRLDRSMKTGKLTSVHYSGDELAAALASEFEVR